MSPATLKTIGDDQIIGGYLETIRRLPKAKRLDALSELLAVTPDSEIRAPLLREFNNLTTRENTDV